MTNWHYYNEDGEKVGPITSRQLKKLVAHGIVAPRTVVETEDGTTGLAKAIQGLTFSEVALKMEPTLRPRHESGIVPPVAGEVYGVAPHNLTERAEEARLEAETSTIVAEVAAEKEAAATLRAANAIKAAAERRAAEALKAADALNAIADKAENKLRRFNASNTTERETLIGKVVDFEFLAGATKGRMGRIFRLRDDIIVPCTSLGL